MKTRLGALAVAAVAGLLAVAAVAGRADAQAQTICSNSNFSTNSGTVACNGTTSPVTATATVRNAAVLTLDTVFGAAPSGLTIPFGTVDALCASTPGSGISCAADTVNTTATWYGDVAFSVKLTGATGSAKLTGTHVVGGSIPAGQLLDGAAGAQPATAYPDAPTTIDLKTAIGNGKTAVTRSFGLLVKSTDAAAAWTGQTAYSVVIE